ncbi:MAG: YdcF family protein, partial [Clostridia bacterium]|nr:YdcF family protein [Clostridia bacterium]
VGEISTKCYVDIPKIIRETVKEIGYTRAKYGFDADTCGILVSLDEQSPDIAQGVNEAIESREGEMDAAEAIGAGDQGMMFGYATNETPELLPIPFVLATNFLRLLKNHPSHMFRADAKAQVSFDYDSGRITTFLCSVQHSADVEPADFRGAGTWDGEVSPVFRERLSHAADLYRAGYAPKILLTGGLDPRNTVTDAEAARRWMLAEGIPESDLLIEEKSRYTHENFIYAREIMEREGMKTALVVSDPLHMKRAMLCARDFGVEGIPSPTPTSRYRTARTIVPFLIRETGCMIAYGVWRIFAQPWRK